MDWRKEDSRYAAAAVAAGVFVAYLIAGNFGLVPSPLTGVGQPTLNDIGVPVLDLGIGIDGEAQPAVAVNPEQSATVLGVVLGTSPDPAAPAPPPAADTRPPVTAIHTPNDGEVLVGADVTVTGRANDDLSGIAGVQVTFRSTVEGGTSQQVAADVDCISATRRSCTWTAHSPLAAGEYEVRAQAADRAGHVESPGPSVIVTLLAASLPGDLGDSTPSLVTTVVDTVGSVAGKIGGLIGSVL